MKTIITLIVIVLLVVFFWPKPYTSSPGFVTQEANEAFEATAKKCVGYSKLTNAEQVAADAPGESICYGWLM